MRTYEITALRIVTVKLTPQDVEDIVVTALNGGIGYWALLDNTGEEYKKMGKDDCVDAWTAKILMDGGSVRLIDVDDDDVTWELTLPKLLSGVKRYIERGMDTYGVFDAGNPDLMNLDADGADTIVQLGLFDEIVFG